MARRLTAAVGMTVAAVLISLLGLSGPAAAVTVEEKVAVMSSWTQTAASSYNAWNSARTNPTPWAAYGFDWSTDYCSASPDNPLGFDFRMPCWRHDFGYRNYKAVDRFSANKARVDDAFYADMRRRCATYNFVLRPACYSLAWTYYQAVRMFGSVVVTQADLDRAARLLPDKAAA
jgi:hypothetical protein